MLCSKERKEKNQRLIYNPQTNILDIWTPADFFQKYVSAQSFAMA